MSNIDGTGAGGAALLKCEELLAGYGRRAILPSINLTIRRGEFWAIVGINGSGKTTLLRTLLGLLPPVGGSYTWSEGVVPSYVPQRSDVDPSLPGRVRDLVREGMDRRWSFLRWRAGTDEAVIKALTDAKCEGLAEEQYPALSEGQKGRVRLARALVSEPNVLILDEPTASVDWGTETAIFDLLDELRLQRGVTVLVVSHRSHVFAGRATHAIFVDRDDGQAIAGPYEEIVNEPRFLARHGPIPNPGDRAAAVDEVDG